MRQTTPLRDDRMLAPTKALGWVIAPVLIVAWVLLWPDPTDTGDRFAWNITPTLTPMVLASAYLGGAYFFLQTATTRAWHTVKGGFVPVTTFATLLGIATILHWENFNHGSPAFWLWAALYFTAPFLVAAAFLANRAYDVPPAEPDTLIPPVVARVLATVGVGSLLTGLAVFAFPDHAIDVWPWPVSPLTARVLAAVLCLGTAGIGALADQRWSSARIMVQVGIGMLVLIVASGVRAHEELLTDRPLTWAFMVGFPGLLLALALWYVVMERRRG